MKREAILRTALVVALLLTLELLCRTGVISARVFIAPSDMVAGLVRLLAQGAVFRQLGKTLYNVAIAYVASIIFGITLGLFVHRRQRLREALDPFLSAYQAVPVVVFYPILISLFGLTPFSLIMLAFMLGAPTMMLATLAGLDQVRPVLRKTGRVFRLSAVRTARRLILPAILPDLFSGLKLAFAYTFTGVLAGEFTMAEDGVGFAIHHAYDSFDNQTMYSLMLLVIVIGMSGTLLLHSWEMRVAQRRRR
jgi:NitT/TauT family transport system permease protein